MNLESYTRKTLKAPLKKTPTTWEKEINNNKSVTLLQSEMLFQVAVYVILNLFTKEKRML